MKTITNRILCAVLALSMILAAGLTLTACNKEPDITATGADIADWFSSETLMKFSASGFTLPDGTEVAEAKDDTTVYLRGGKDVFQITVMNAFASVKNGNDGVYLPTLTTNASGDEVATEILQIDGIDPTSLYPDGNATEIILVYKSAKRMYECRVSYDEGTELVCVAFADKTDIYRPLLKKN